jgi:hypothetical protein
VVGVVTDPLKWHKNSSDLLLAEIDRAIACAFKISYICID